MRKILKTLKFLIFRETIFFPLEKNSKFCATSLLQQMRDVFKRKDKGE